MPLAMASIGPGALSKSPASKTEVLISDAALTPSMGPVGTAAETSETADTAGYINVYTVHAGDTLKGIANMFEVTPATIMWANDLTANAKLKEGTVIIIPSIDGLVVTLKKGDTLSSLAKKYGVSQAAIAYANELSPDEALSVGDMLIIPNAKLATTPAASSATIKAPAARSTQKPSAGTYFIYPLPVNASHFVRGPHSNYGGVDLGAPTGTPIYAIADGVVMTSKDSGYNTGWGSYVLIGHTLPSGVSAQSLSAHMSKVVARAGQTVQAGDIIGYVGTTGKVTGPHLHIELRGVSNPYADPNYGR
jgi:murein DD-endopeptidase MepM/ murein hydrolase activator NlpD